MGKPHQYPRFQQSFTHLDPLVTSSNVRADREFGFVKLIMMRCSYPLGDVSRELHRAAWATEWKPLLVSIFAGEVLNELDAYLGDFVDVGCDLAGEVMWRIASFH
jgi:hypothetical protein